MKRKYVIYEDDEVEHYVVFDMLIDHSEMARRMGIGAKILSAGFVQFGPDGAYCYGESVSLNMKSRDDVDSKIINGRMW